MPTVALTSALRSEYSSLFDTCVADPARQKEVENGAAGVEAGRSHYQAAGDPLSIPWYVIGAIHALESNFRFQRHLHNGDPLTARTVQVPAGRPASGTPPFSWAESATDALRLQRLDKVTDWSIASMLYQLEAYNGFGYRSKHPDVLSPYLWSFSNHYKSGKYVGDGTWSQAAKSQQCGAAVILRRLAEKGVIHFSTAGVPLAKNPGELAPLVRFSSKGKTDDAAKLQEALNRFPGVFVKVDGVAGTKTSDACMRVLGHYLTGDPRAR